jgi:hypothetical protein
MQRLYSPFVPLLAEIIHKNIGQPGDREQSAFFAKPAPVKLRADAKLGAEGAVEI